MVKGLKSTWVLKFNSLLTNMAEEQGREREQEREQKKSKDKYTILLPTYEEKDNLPLVIWLIMKYMDDR